MTINGNLFSSYLFFFYFLFKIANGSSLQVIGVCNVRINDGLPLKNMLHVPSLIITPHHVCLAYHIVSLCIFLQD